MRLLITTIALQFRNDPLNIASSMQATEVRHFDPDFCRFRGVVGR
jgi:hypothetical protein